MCCWNILNCKYSMYRRNNNHCSDNHTRPNSYYRHSNPNRPDKCTSSHPNNLRCNMSMSNRFRSRSLYYRNNPHYMNRNCYIDRNNTMTETSRRTHMSRHRTVWCRPIDSCTKRFWNYRYRPLTGSCKSVILNFHRYSQIPRNDIDSHSPVSNPYDRNTRFRRLPFHRTKRPPNRQVPES